MKTYTVHLNPQEKNETRQIVFVKEGVAWPALFIPFFWLLYHRLWLEAAAYLGLSLILSAGLTFLGQDGFTLALLSFLLQLMVALEGNELRRFKLERKGARMAAVVRAADEEEAEERFLRSYEGALPLPHASRPWGKPLTGGVWPASEERRKPAEAGDVLGVFPEPGRMAPRTSFWGFSR